MVFSVICLVANDLAHLIRNGGVGTYFWLLAHLLARKGLPVHLLFACEQIENRAALSDVRGRLAAAGIGLSLLTDFPEPSFWRLPTHGSNPLLQRSERIRHALEILSRKQRLDLIEFADWGACGFRSVQARRTGLALADSRILVRLHGSSQWGRKGNLQGISSREDLRTDFAEQYACEHADLQRSPCRYMLDQARQAGWTIRPEAQVDGYPFPGRPIRPVNLSGEVNEIVFFGRLEVRKGLLLFLEACRQLDPQTPLAFVGKETWLWDGRRASAVIRQALPGRRVTLHTKLDHEQGLTYLRQPGRLAILPSLADNLPFALIECATQGIPFLASNVGGIPELLAEPSLQQTLLFQPTVPDLLHCLRSYLDRDAGQRRSCTEEVSHRLDPDRNNARLMEGYASAISTQYGVRTTRNSTPLVSVIVPHYHMPDYLPEALASLNQQTYPRLEVLVVDDGSTCPRARQVLKEQECLYPHVRFLRLENRGPGAARNAGLAEARGELVLLFDADNIALPRLVETLVRGLGLLPEVAALTCPVLGVSDGPDPGQRRPIVVNAFAGGPVVLACLENVFGDSTALFRTADLRAVGGFEEDRSTPWEDWLTYLRLIGAGFRIETAPAFLFHYRVRHDSHTARLIHGPADRERLLQILLQRGFSGRDLPPGVHPASLWAALIGFGQLSERQATLRHHLLDALNERLRRLPRLHAGVKWLLGSLLRLVRRTGR